jgi:hypothetical protein
MVWLLGEFATKLNVYWNRSAWQSVHVGQLEGTEKVYMKFYTGEFFFKFVIFG